MAFPGYGSFRGGRIGRTPERPNWTRQPVGRRARIGCLDSAHRLLTRRSSRPAELAIRSGDASPVCPAVAYHGGAADPEWLGDLGLNLRLEAGNNVRIRSPILEIGGKGAVEIAGRLRPPLAGELSATPGGSLFLNRAFKLQEASVLSRHKRYRASSLRPRNDGDTACGGFQPIDVTVTAQGLIPDIKLSYASNPPYDEGTIVGLLFNATALGAQVGSLNAFAPTTNILLPPNAFEQTPGGTFAHSLRKASKLDQRTIHCAPAGADRTGPRLSVGLSDLSINVAPTGTVGVQARRLLGNNISAIYGASVNYPYRMTFGLESRPTPETSVVFTAFTQQGLYCSAR